MKKQILFSNFVKFVKFFIIISATCMVKRMENNTFLGLFDWINSYIARPSLQTQWLHHLFWSESGFISKISFYEDKET